MAREINTRIQHKLDTVAAWEAVKDTFVPLSGELIIYKTTNGVHHFKIGDGTATLANLPFVNHAVALTTKSLLDFAKECAVGTVTHVMLTGDSYTGGGLPTTSNGGNCKYGFATIFCRGANSVKVYIDATGPNKANSSIYYNSYNGTDWIGWMQFHEWTKNEKGVDGYVSGTGEQAINQVWKTDASGDPAWRNMPKLTIKQNNTVVDEFQGTDKAINLTDTIPNNGTLTITQNSVFKGTFSANQADAKTIDLSDTWLPNTKGQPGFVAEGNGNANKVWRTDGEGNPGWGDWTTANNGKLTIKQNDTVINTFTANQATNTEVNLTDTTYGVATTSALGLVKSGGDVTVDSSTGIMSVVDDSHTHHTQYYTKEQVYTRDQVYTKTETEAAVRNIMNSWLTTNIYNQEY